METEILEIKCECGGIDVCECVKGELSTRVLRILQSHTCTFWTPENTADAIAYAHACGYRD